MTASHTLLKSQLCELNRSFILGIMSPSLRRSGEADMFLKGATSFVCGQQLAVLRGNLDLVLRRVWRWDLTPGPLHAKPILGPSSP